MRKAMHEAELGDDVFGDDPTVNRLQERAAEMFGFEAALLFPTGTQSNLAALMSHCGRGEEVILGMEAHSYRYEAGGLSVLGSIQPQAVPNRADGTLDLAEVEAAIKPDDPHFARTRLLALENTITGRVLSADYLEQGGRAGETEKPGHPPRWRAHLQRRDAAEDESEGSVRRLRLGVVVPVEGAGCAGRHRAAR